MNKVTEVGARLTEPSKPAPEDNVLAMALAQAGGDVDYAVELAPDLAAAVSLSLITQ